MSNRAQRSFSVGEVSPRLHARAGTAEYAEGLRTLRNAVVMPMGGVESRSGTHYAESTKADGVAYLIPFVRDTGQEYMIEAGALYFRLWLDGAQVTVGTPSAWSASSVSYTAGTSVSHSGTNYICILSNTSGAGNEPGTGGGADEWYALTSNILELPTPYALAEVPALQWADDGTARRFISHPTYPMRELIRLSATAWTFLVSTFDAADNVAAPANLAVTGSSGTASTFTNYKVTAVAGTRESLPSNSDGWNKRPGPTDAGNQAVLSLAWDAVSGATSYNVYMSLGPTDSYYFRAQVSSNSWTDNTTVTLAQLKAGTDPPSTSLALTDFTVATQYPGVIGVHQQRLIVSGQTATPDRVYGSRTGNFDNFFPRVPIQDDDAMSWRQVATRLNRVKYVVEVDETLYLFSETGEGIVRGDTDGILRPGEINPRMFSHHGAGDVMPLEVDTALLYVQARGALVRGILPGEDRGRNLSLTATHLTRSYTITSWCYQQTPHSVVWMVRSDGVLLSLTFDRESGTVGWAHHDTDGTLVSVACLPENGRDTVYAVVTRTIDGSTKRYVERFTDRDTAWPETICMDSVLWADNRVVDGETVGGPLGAPGTPSDEPAGTPLGPIEIPGPGPIPAGDPVVPTYTPDGPEDGPFEPELSYDRLEEVVPGGSVQHSATATTALAPSPAYGSTWSFSYRFKQGERRYLAVGLRIINGSLNSFVTVCADLQAGSITFQVDSTVFPNDVNGEWLHFSVGPTITDDGDGYWLIAFTCDVDAGQISSGDWVSFGGSASRTESVVLLNGAATDVVSLAIVQSYVGVAGEGVFIDDNLPTLDTFTNSALDAAVTPAPERVLRVTHPTTGVVYLLDVTGTTDDTATGTTRSALPADMLDVPLTSWSIANIESLDGLDHLEGKAVSVVADGVVLASPNNPAYSEIVVTAGAVTLPTAGAQVFIGLPFTVDLETLDLDSATTAVRGKPFRVNAIGAWLEESRPFWAGNRAPATDALDLDVLGVVRLTDEAETVIDDDVVFSGFTRNAIPAKWTKGGRIFLRQVDPVPLTVLALVPIFDAPERE